MTNRLQRCLGAGLFGAALLASALAVGPAAAQSQTTQLLLSRMDYLEQRLRELEVEVFRSDKQKSSTGAPTRAAEIELRLNQLESSIRALTGRAEEDEHQRQQLAERLDRFMQDLDVRLKQLEDAVAAASTAPPAGTAMAPAQGTTPAGPATTNLAAVPARPGPAAPGPAAPAPASTAPVPAAPAVGTVPAPTGAILPPGPPPEQYKFAIGLVRRQAFADAERAFREFLAVHPEDGLAPNAQYWLGETLYVRQMYDEAARAFLTAYQDYPQSDKASDSLLKLGITLTHLGQRDEACATFQELLRQLPKNERRLRPKAELERRNAKCG